jgi:hypothetical protein
MKSTLSFRFAVIAAAAGLMFGNTLVSVSAMAQTIAAKASVQASMLAKAK